MWIKPWTMKEGFLIGGGLIFAGLMLQLAVGGVAWAAFAWPANGIVLAAFLAIAAALFVLRRRVYAFRFIATYQSAIPTLNHCVCCTDFSAMFYEKRTDFSAIFRFFALIPLR